MRLKIVAVIALAGLAIAVILGKRVFSKLTYPADVGEAFLRSLVSASERYRFDCGVYPESLEELQGTGCRNREYVTVGGTYERLFSTPTFSDWQGEEGVSINIEGSGEARGVTCQVEVPGQPICEIDWEQQFF